MTEIEDLLKQVEELHQSMVDIKSGKSIIDLGVIIESQILDIVLNNYREELMKIRD
ncbi:aspartyl-phosphate phosphatase Spo0E family protein [Desulfosporosinus sp. PR]|uniref:Spo0E family sporulation regulatory protein-aspartic acid phosphatase n=1 Tax=Candidatus Desulfosporosinus nitrosoreducens TaxID=3401928 RepID=UPI0027FF03D8|nr:Spo0E family sporulation regulatory protein-aspartic acid phosphatase [Desulfosporosinus sp. PR]MDQ7097131.1 aspartyl-phosphate phosphatase Spo0E family protein [Desulfosporosinus sp. PR]